MSQLLVQSVESVRSGSGSRVATVMDSMGRRNEEDDHQYWVASGFPRRYSRSRWVRLLQ